MVESFEVVFKEYNTATLFEYDTKTFELCLTWYDIINGEKRIRKKTCEEKMSNDEFLKFKNKLKCYHQIIE